MIIAVVRSAVRDLTGADGATFVLREGNNCHYVDEEAVSPLWKGQRLPHGTVRQRLGDAQPPACRYRGHRYGFACHKGHFPPDLCQKPGHGPGQQGKASGPPSAPTGPKGAYRIRRTWRSCNPWPILPPWPLENVRLYTALREQVVELEAQKLAAEEAHRTKSEFLANMSHEIRTPLNGIMGMLQLLGASPLEDEERQYVNVALQSSLRLTTLLSDILDLSRIRGGETPDSTGSLFHQQSDRYHRRTAVLHGPGQRHRPRIRHCSRCAADPGRGPRPAPAGSLQPGGQRHQIHRSGQGQAGNIPGLTTRTGSGPRTLHHQRYGHRHFRSADGQPFSAVRPGRRQLYASFSGSRARARHCPPPCGSPGRRPRPGKLRGPGHPRFSCPSPFQLPIQDHDSTGNDAPCSKQKPCTVLVTEDDSLSMRALKGMLEYCRLCMCGSEQRTRCPAGASNSRKSTWY